MPTDPMLGALGTTIGGEGEQLAHAQAQACIINPWPWPWPQTVPPQQPTWAPLQQPEQHTHYHFTPSEQRLSDDDVERIARRVAELLKGGSCPASTPSTARACSCRVRAVAASRTSR